MSYSFEPYKTNQDTEHHLSTLKMAAILALMALLPDERKAGVDSSTVPIWDLVLVTKKGLLKLTRNRTFGASIELVLPKIPDETLDALILQIFNAKPYDPNEVFNGFSPPKRPTARYYRLPQDSIDGKPILLQYAQPNPVEGSTNIAIAGRAVVDGEFGQVSQPIDDLYGLDLCGIVTPEGRYENPSQETVLSLSDGFKQFTIAVANVLGGASQISSPCKEGRPIPADKQLPQDWVLTEWRRLGYIATVAIIEAANKSDPESRIITGTKSSRGSKDTVVGKLVPISSHAIFNPEWAFWRGLKPKGKVSLQDLNTLAPR